MSFWQQYLYALQNIIQISTFPGLQIIVSEIYTFLDLQKNSGQVFKEPQLSH